jgi:dUTP pyrophosphatase
VTGNAAAHRSAIAHGGAPPHELTIRIRRVSDLADLPSYRSRGAAGMDLHAALPAAVVIAPGEIGLVPCGFAIAIPPGYEGQVRPRSGLALRHGISMPNAPGTIDSDYRGEVQVPLINLGREPFTVAPNARIAQLVVAPIARCAVLEVDALDDTPRGAGGFGSTGT